VKTGPTRAAPGTRIRLAGRDPDDQQVCAYADGIDAAGRTLDGLGVRYRAAEPRVAEWVIK
jgi:hypothetical protein